MKKADSGPGLKTGRLLSQLDKIIKEDLKTRAWWALEDIEISSVGARVELA